MREELRPHPYSLVLVLIVASIGVLGLAPERGLPQIVLIALEGSTLVAALHASRASRRRTEIVASIVALLIVVAAIALLAGQLEVGASRAAGALLVAVAPFSIVRGVARRLRVDRVITLDTVFGVLCIYLLVGMFFAFLFGAVDRVGGQAVLSGGDTGTDFLFFSFTTLTTVGYGDLVPTSDLGKTIAIFEMLFGQIYLVTIVSLIVGNLGRGRRREEPETPADEIPG